MTAYLHGFYQKIFDFVFYCCRDPAGNRMRGGATFKGIPEDAQFTAISQEAQMALEGLCQGYLL